MITQYTFALTFFLLTTSTSAQLTTDYYTVPSTAGEGLSDARIEDLATRDDKLWIATDGGGVNTFDGQNWTVISRADGLPTNRTTAIVFDNEGNPWIGTRGPGIATLINGEWVTYRVSDGLTSGWINCAMRSDDGSLWFGTRAGISIYDGAGWSQVTSDQGLINEFVHAIFQDESGMIWVGTNGGVAYFDGDSWSAFTEDHGLSNNSVTAISQDKEDNLWFGTWNNQINILNPMREWSQILTKERTRAITRGPDDLMYVAGSEGLYVQMANGEFTYEPFNDDEDLHNYGAIINDIEIDNNNNILLATWNGMIQYTKGQWSKTTAKIGLCNDYIIDIVEDAKGHLWMASPSRGVSKFDGENWQTYNYNNLFDGESIYGLTADQVGNIWVANSSGAYRYADGSWSQFTVDDGLPHNLVYDVFEDQAGRFWFGTFGGVGIWDGSGFEQLTVDDGLVDNRVQVIYQDASDIFWFVTPVGISIYDGNTFSAFQATDQLPTNDVRAIAEKELGQVWVATTGGVVIYENQTWRSPDNPLSNNSVLTLHAEEGGSIWAGTFNGLNLFRGDDSHSQYFSNDGTLYHNSISAVYKAKDGRLWLGTPGAGVFVMDVSTSKHDHLWSSSVSLFPNPTSSWLTIELDESIHALNLYSSRGELIEHRTTLATDIEKVAVADWAPGLYFVELKTSAGERKISSFVKMETRY